MSVNTGKGMISCIFNNASTAQRAMFRTFMQSYPTFHAACFAEDRDEARADLLAAKNASVIDQDFYDLAYGCVGDDPSGGGPF